MLALLCCLVCSIKIEMQLPRHGICSLALRSAGESGPSWLTGSTGHSRLRESAPQCAVCWRESARTADSHDRRNATSRE